MPPIKCNLPSHCNYSDDGFKFCILEQLIATVLFICISSINNKRSLLRFQSTTAPTNRGWSACGVSALMLSGEGNAGERWKTTIGPISEKSNFARAAHFFCTFLCRCFARLQRETSRNFLVTRFTRFFCRTCSRCSLFFTAAHFHLALVATSISHFVTAATKFSCCSSNKKCLLWLFICHSRPLSPFFSLSFGGLQPTFSFSLSFSYSIFQLCRRHY